jgi:ABC-2 type transport system permease protein
MNHVLSAVRIGLGRGWTEFRHMLSTPVEHMFNVFVAVIILTVLYFQRDNAVGGTDLPLATLVLPGVVGMLVAYNSTIGPPSSSPSSARTGRCCGPRLRRSAWSATSPVWSCASRCTQW